MNRNKSIHMSSTEFREYGHAVIDWIAEYYENVESYSVKADERWARKNKGIIVRNLFFFNLTFNTNCFETTSDIINSSYLYFFCFQN